MPSTGMSALAATNPATRPAGVRAGAAGRMEYVVNLQVSLERLRQNFESAGCIAQSAGRIRAAARNHVWLAPLGLQGVGETFAFGVHVETRRTIT